MGQGQGHSDLQGQNHILDHNFVSIKDRDLQKTSLESYDQEPNCGRNQVKVKGQGQGQRKGQSHISGHNLVSYKDRDLQQTESSFWKALTKSKLAVVFGSRSKVKVTVNLKVKITFWPITLFLTKIETCNKRL